MMGLKTKIRDWWRGYSDADMASAREKLRAPNLKPGQLVFVTEREANALRANPVIF